MPSPPSSSKWPLKASGRGARPSPTDAASPRTSTTSQLRPARRAVSWVMCRWTKSLEPMIGAVLDKVRSASKDGTVRPKSLAVQEQIRGPLRRFYRYLIRKRGFTGPNPAADLKDFMSKYPSRRARSRPPGPLQPGGRPSFVFDVCRRLPPMARLCGLLHPGGCTGQELHLLALPKLTSSPPSLIR
jgi:hypothetical protein